MPLTDADEKSPSAVPADAENMRSEHPRSVKWMYCNAWSANLTNWGSSKSTVEVVVVGEATARRFHLYYSRRD